MTFHTSQAPREVSLMALTHSPARLSVSQTCVNCDEWSIGRFLRLSWGADAPYVKGRSGSEGVSWCSLTLIWNFDGRQKQDFKTTKGANLYSLVVHSNVLRRWLQTEGSKVKCYLYMIRFKSLPLKLQGRCQDILKVNPSHSSNVLRVETNRQANKNPQQQ